MRHTAPLYQLLWTERFIKFMDQTSLGHGRELIHRGASCIAYARSADVSKFSFTGFGIRISSRVLFEEKGVMTTIGDLDD